MLLGNNALFSFTESTFLLQMTVKDPSSNSKIFFQHPKWKGKIKVFLNEYFSTAYDFDKIL